MKRLKAMSNREWIQKHEPDKIDKKKKGGVVGCPKNYKLDNEKCGFDDCDYCWNMPAKRNGKYIMKVVKE